MILYGYQGDWNLVQLGLEDYRGFNNEMNAKLLDDSIVISKLRGARGKQVYHKFWELVGSQRRIWRELLTDPAKIKRLHRELRVDYEAVRAIRDTPMRCLLACLAMALLNGREDCPDGADPRDWGHNIRLAKSAWRKDGQGKISGRWKRF